MSEEQVRKTGTEEQKKVRNKRWKTRCYYTDYVNHAVRFYLSTPDTLKMDGKRKADVENWIAVQTVFHCLGADDRKTIEEIYRSHFRLPEGVRMYCEKTGADAQKIWVLITRVSAAIARRRGLV